MTKKILPAPEEELDDSSRGDLSPSEFYYPSINARGHEYPRVAVVDIQLNGDGEIYSPRIVSPQRIKVLSYKF